MPIVSERGRNANALAVAFAMATPSFKMACISGSFCKLMINDMLDELLIKPDWMAVMLEESILAGLSATEFVERALLIERMFFAFILTVPKVGERST